MLLPLSARTLRRRLIFAVSAPAVLAVAHLLTAQSPAPGSLQDGFAHPTPDARPMMRWWWFGPAVVKPELKLELETMHKAGIGGVEIQPVYPMALDDEAQGIHNLKYLSPEFLDDVKFANETARGLGMRVDITLGSGWPYGGPATPLALASSKLRVVYLPLAGPVAAPKLKEGESIVAAFTVSGTKEKFDAASAVRFNPAALAPAGAGERTALYFIASHTGQEVKRSSYGAEGPVLDHMSRAAIENHLQKVATPLLAAFGDHPPTATFSDSLEVYGADWTPTLPEEFLKRRGYDLIPRLPELLAGGTPEADAIRHDWGVTLSDLVRENYLQPVADFARAHGSKFRSQTYGFPPVMLADELTAPLPEGEGPQWRSFSFTRWASSANHLAGNNITSAETWTWLHSPVFRATPLDMKVEADRMFVEGVNQFVGHGWPYSPTGAGEPGWSLYAAAVFNSHNPWFAVMPDVTAYLQRVSWLLRQGKSANDVAILLPEDDAQASFAPGNSRGLSISDDMKERIAPELMATVLDAGYNVDYIDARMIDKLGAVPYPVLLIPSTERMPLATYQTIAAYAAKGGKVIAVGTLPKFAPGLKDQGDSPAVAALSNTLFQTAGHKGVTTTLESLRKTLRTALTPDLLASDDVKDLGFIHRKLETSDVYFVVNSSNRELNTQVSFRTAHPVAEAWDPDTAAVLFTAANQAGSQYALHLAPYESRVFVFSDVRAAQPTTQPKPPAEHLLADVSNGWTARFGDDKTEVKLDKPQSWTEIEGKKFFSGEAVYTKTIEVSASDLKGGKILIDFGQGVQTIDPRPAGATGVRALLDPPLREAAIVTVNGQRAGSLWHAPYRLNVTKQLKAGANTVEVRVYNTAINELAGQKPRDFAPLYAKFGKRFVMQDIENLQPVPSGMTGAVKLIAEE
jgi:hypothetical protein